MISPAIILSKVTEKIIKSSPVTAPVNNSLPFLTLSALSPPDMIWIVAISMMTREIAPAMPARNPRSCDVKPLGSTFRQPKAVSMLLPSAQVGSKASRRDGEKRGIAESTKE